FPAYDLPAPCRAEVFALSAECTCLRIPGGPVILCHPDRSIRTDGCAGSASGTFFSVYLHLFFKSLGLRIVAPLTFQRTALEKYGGTDPVSVMDRKLLYIGYIFHLNLPQVLPHFILKFEL